jgi:apolipoprotein N-acyltransferase
MRELVWRIPLGVVAGLIGLVVFPTENIWILAPLIPMLTYLAVLGLRFWPAVLVGFISGQAFYISHIEWISLYLGPIPLIALSTTVSIYHALGAGLAAWLFRSFDSKGKKIIPFALLLASIWTLREFGANNFPYGGFPWSRLSMTQSESFMASWVWWGGMSLLSFVIAFIGSVFALLILSRSGRHLLRPALLGVMVAILVPLLTPIGLTTTFQGEKVIAAVQGNARAGLFSREAPGTILQNHLDASEIVVQSGREIDLLVWPENASDLDPLRSPQARAKINALSNQLDAPFVFGTITKRGDETFNSTILWTPEVGPVDFYDKKQPVPFAEYAPDREFWRMFAPELIDMIPRGYSFGTRDGIYEISDFTAGTLICFEIAEDSILRELTFSGAQVILSQTNNADFGYSDETFQQAAIARLRAIETGRAVVNISTVGLSAIYLPNGKVLSEVEWYTPAAMIESVLLYSGLTPGVVIGSVFDWVNALVVVGFSILTKRRRTS